MTKIISLTVLHYGLSYLDAALRSVRDHVDECWVAYTPLGSHGFRTSEPCPESRDELYSIARAVTGDKLRWYEGVWPHEGAQRDSIYQRCPDADVIVVVDSDEVWNEPLLMNAIGHYSEAQLIGCRVWRVPMVHFWRSFNRAVINDAAQPARILFPKVAENPDFKESYINMSPWIKPMAHFGYAQPVNITRYKILTHGHRGEWRPDWFDTKFLPNAQTDVHPTNHNYWNPVDVNPLDYMPDWMQGHPFFGRDLIE